MINCSFGIIGTKNKKHKFKYNNIPTISKLSLLFFVLTKRKDVLGCPNTKHLKKLFV